jgi:hypothetical protein
MNIVLAGDRVGDRAAGKPRVLTAADPNDPAVAVAAGRQLVLSGIWRSAPKTGDATDKACYLVRAKTPAALAVGRVAIGALARGAPTSGGCYWCTAKTLVDLSCGEDTYPDHRDPLVQAWLGNPCGKCRMRHATSDEMAASLALYHELVAEGVPPKVAAASRTRVAAYRRLQEIRALEQAKPPKLPAPTRVLHSDGRRRVPDPPYYQRKPRRAR